MRAISVRVEIWRTILRQEQKRTVGASLLAIAADQPLSMPLTDRYREQARSHSEYIRGLFGTAQPLPMLEANKDEPQLLGNLRLGR